ncbi:hypothetical protein Tco_1195075 [Tanacetum coccineum]
MSTLTYAETHNIVVFLEKPAERKGFHEIIDFLNANQIRYALTVNPIIYTSCIKQFWTSAMVKTVNQEVQIQALIHGKKVIITEASIRRALHLKDADGTECLPNAMIFAELERMGMQLTELINLCTQLSDRVLALKTIKTTKAMEITTLKKRVKKLEKQVSKRTHKLKRLYEVGVTRKVQSSEDEGLGIEEDASKQGRNYVDVEEERAEGNEMMFDTYIFDGDEVFAHKDKEVVSTAEKEVTAAPSIPTIGSKILVSAALNTSTTTADVTPEEVDLAQEITLAHALAALRSAKLKEKGPDVNVSAATTKVNTVVTTATTTTIVQATTPRAKGISFREPSSRPILSVQVISGIKDKGKAILVEHEEPIKKKEQIRLDEEYARKLAEDELEEIRLEEEKTQLLAEMLTAQEQDELTDEEKVRLCVQLMEKRRKHFAELRAKEKRNKPPTKAQKKKFMITYLKNMGGFKISQLKSKRFDEIQKMFDLEVVRVNTFVSMDTETVEKSSKKEENSVMSGKRAGDDL